MKKHNQYTLAFAVIVAISGCAPQQTTKSNSRAAPGTLSSLAALYPKNPVVKKTADNKIFLNEAAGFTQADLKKMYESLDVAEEPLNASSDLTVGSSQSSSSAHGKMNGTKKTIGRLRCAKIDPITKTTNTSNSSSEASESESTTDGAGTNSAATSPAATVKDESTYKCVLNVSEKDSLAISDKNLYVELDVAEESFTNKLVNKIASGTNVTAKLINTFVCIKEEIPNKADPLYSCGLLNDVIPAASNAKTVAVMPTTYNPSAVPAGTAPTTTATTPASTTQTTGSTQPAVYSPSTASH